MAAPALAESSTGRTHSGNITRAACRCWGGVAVYLAMVLGLLVAMHHPQAGLSSR